MNQYRGGKELLESVSSLTAKVELLKAEMAHEKSAGGAGSTLSRWEFYESPFSAQKFRVNFIT
jgi:hypothetical protein